MSAHTAGPWRWEVNPTTKHVNLCGGHRREFDLTVVDFTRWGMSSAMPRFRDMREGELNLMTRCTEFMQVAPGRAHHASWFQLLNHPDANLIAAAPDLLAALEGLDRDGWTPARWEAAVRAMAKARGES